MVKTNDRTRFEFQTHSFFPTTSTRHVSSVRDRTTTFTPAHAFRAFRIPAFSVKRSPPQEDSMLGPHAVGNLYQVASSAPQSFAAAWGALPTRRAHVATRVRSCRSI
jgi:hypothetical protein